MEEASEKIGQEAGGEEAMSDMHSQVNDQWQPLRHVRYGLEAVAGAMIWSAVIIGVAWIITATIGA